MAKHKKTLTKLKTKISTRTALLIALGLIIIGGAAFGIVPSLLGPRITSFTPSYGIDGSIYLSWSTTGMKDNSCGIFVGNTTVTGILKGVGGRQLIYSKPTSGMITVVSPISTSYTLGCLKPDGVTWVKQTINVVPPYTSPYSSIIPYIPPYTTTSTNYNYSYVLASKSQTTQSLKRGGVAVVTMKLQNTGNASWETAAAERVQYPLIQAAIIPSLSSHAYMFLFNSLISLSWGEPFKSFSDVSGGFTSMSLSGYQTRYANPGGGEVDFSLAIKAPDNIVPGSYNVCFNLKGLRFGDTSSDPNTPVTINGSPVCFDFSISY
ncbi:MAG: hypothetical protein PHU42_00755 [Patescibacteria group bacterium]|nr:hypothetical protein [Patescibacteria group bacterium]